MRVKEGMYVLNVSKWFSRLKTPTSRAKCCIGVLLACYNDRSVGEWTKLINQVLFLLIFPSR